MVTMKILFAVAASVWLFGFADVLGLLPNWQWICTKLGWHRPPNYLDFDGCSSNGSCPRCGKHVMQDSQGNWS